MTTQKSIRVIAFGGSKAPAFGGDRAPLKVLPDPVISINLSPRIEQMQKLLNNKKIIGGTSVLEWNYIKANAPRLIDKNKKKY